MSEAYQARRSRELHDFGVAVSYGMHDPKGLSKAFPVKRATAPVPSEFVRPGLRRR